MHAMQKQQLYPNSTPGVELGYSFIMRRKEPLEKDEVYHVMSKSIAGYKIFTSESDYQRMLHAMEYFLIDQALPKFSHFLKRVKENGKSFQPYLDECFPKPKRVIQIIAYCLMPTHIHLLLKPLKEDGAVEYIGNVLNSYARFFNIRHKRNGPLWSGRFKNVRVQSDNQLWHLTRYLHLNPVTAHLIDKPQDWQFSSYREYVTPSTVKHHLCHFGDLLDIKPRSYRKFAEDQIDYQRELAKIKTLLLE